MKKVDPTLIRGFLQNGQIEEVEDFVDEYIDSLGDATASKMFSQYLMLNIRFTTIAYIAELGHDQQEAQEWLPGMQTITQNVSRKELKEYICEMLRCALELREQASKSQSHNLLRQALEYIDHNFTDENLSLKEVAGYTNVSANYFSAMFSQEMRQTFVEYLTQKRMNRAKELLRQSEKRTAEIAAEVGYKDPHYFSFVFRKTQGCTPRDYRTGGKRG
jgi:two-component system response regulator YesN